MRIEALFSEGEAQSVRRSPNTSVVEYKYRLRKHDKNREIMRATLSDDRIEYRDNVCLSDITVCAM